MHVLFGIMSDRRGCRQVYIFGALFVAAMAFPFSGCWKAVRSY
ncbi:putative inner membrane protein [Salmonella enterica subsp. enterica serovar Heidelberg str. 77-1831]|nr:putative inner membrane protein [Salmonella enterica subsp. enterica serovar Heidelberg str. 77-1831]